MKYNMKSWVSAGPEFPSVSSFPSVRADEMFRLDNSVIIDGSALSLIVVIENVFSLRKHSLENFQQRSIVSYSQMIFGSGNMYIQGPSG